MGVSRPSQLIFVVDGHIYYTRDNDHIIISHTTDAHMYNESVHVYLATCEPSAWLYINIKG